MAESAWLPIGLAELLVLILYPVSRGCGEEVRKKWDFQMKSVGKMR
jgi:hypothetical protein